MSTKDWRRLGVVSVRDHFDRVTTYASLPDAVNAVGRWKVLALRKGHLGFRWMTEAFLGRFGERWEGGDSHLFYDDMGLVIPIWRLHEEAAREPVCTRVRHAWIKGRRYDPERDFRNGPISGSGNWRGRYWRRLRHMRTTAERRDNDALSYDAETLDYGVRVRGKRSAAHLPTVYDDEYRGDQGRSWKRNRPHQHH